MSSQWQLMASWLAEPDDETVRPNQPHPAVGLLQLGSRTAFLLVIFMLLHEGVTKVFAPGEQAYQGRWIMGECMRSRSALLIPAFVVLAAALVFLPRLRQGWTQFEGGTSLRWFIGSVAAVLAWAGTAYSYNYYFDQPHLADRLSVLLLAALLLWRPVFVLPFVATFWLVIQQFRFPDLGYGVLEAEFRPVANVLILFFAAFLTRASFGGRKMHGFLFLTLCLVVTDYWVPGWGKLRMGWLVHDHPHLVFAAAYTHGWLAFLEPSTVASISGVMSALDWPIRVLTVFIECGSILFFAHARSAKWFLILFTLLLGMFFLAIGYFFWKWMLLQGFLLVLLFRKNDPAALAWRRALFTRPRFAVSIFVTIGAGIWFAPARLAWWDTPLASALRYEADGRSGTTYELSPRFFAPYDSHVTMALFTGLLTPRPALTSSYGVTGDTSVAAALYRAQSPEDVIRIENVMPDRRPAHEAFRRQFEDFVRKTVSVSNHAVAAGTSPVSLSLLRAPPFLWSFARGNPYRHDEPITSVRIYLVSSFFAGKAYVIFRRDLIDTITVAIPE